MDDPRKAQTLGEAQRAEARKEALAGAGAVYAECLERAIFTTLANCVPQKKAP